VAITFLPQIAKPKTMPPPPRMRIHKGTLKPVRGTEPVRRIYAIAAKGAIAFPTSLDPWAKATKQALSTWNRPSWRSTGLGIGEYF
jgi:hypothetical protein